MRRHLRLVRGGAPCPPEAPPLDRFPFTERDLARTRPLAPSVLFAAALFAFVFSGFASDSLRLAIALGAPFALAGLLGPSWGRRSAARFDRDLVTLLARDAVDALEPRLMRAWGMRLFASRDVFFERVGRVALARGDATSARRAFAHVLGTFHDEDAAPLSVRLGYAHACYALGDDVEASWTYRRILERDGVVPKVAVSLAHALWRRGVELDEIEHAVVTARAASDEERATLALLRGLTAARRGDHRRARAALGTAAATHSERVASLRAELWRALRSSSHEGEGRVLAFPPRSA